MAALECIRAAIYFCRDLSDDQIKAQTIHKIQRQMSSIICWISVCTTWAPRFLQGDAVGRYFNSILTLVVYCDALDRKLSEALLSSPEFASTFVLVWSLPQTVDPRDLYYVWTSGPYRDPFVDVLDLCMQHEVGARSLTSILLDSEDVLVEFCHALGTRIDSLSQVAALPEVEYEDVIAEFSRFLSITERLNDTPPIRSVLRDAEHLRTFSRATRCCPYYP